MKIAIGCDEAALTLKKSIIRHLNKNLVFCKDFGAGEGEIVLYPDVAKVIALAVKAGGFDRGILICGTGIGMSITANKIRGIRAAVCHDPYSAERARKSNGAQILCMGARVIGEELAKYIVDVWLACDFTGGNSLTKVQRIKEIENENL